MNSVTPPYIKRALLWLTIATAIYLLLNGAQMFETILIVPNWTSAPPESLYLFQGKYGLDFQTFWIVFHSLHEITFILAIAFCWKIKPLRYWLLGLLALHIGVRGWTIGYFAPTIIEFQHLQYSQTVDPALLQKASLWQMLNYLRVGIFMAISLAFIPLIYKTASLLNQKTK